MPFDFDRIIDHQLYLATQQCIQPYAQQRRVSSAPAPTTTAAAAAGVGPARTAGARKSYLGSLVSPWSASSGGSSSNGGRCHTAYRHPARPSAQGYSPVDLFFTAPVGIPARGGSGLYGGGGGGETHAQAARDDDSTSSLDQFVTAPVGDFTIGNGAARMRRRPRVQEHGNDSRPGSSDSDNWSFATASGGSDSGNFSGLDTTVDLTPSPPPSVHGGKITTHISTAASHPPRQTQSIDPEPGPGPVRSPHHNGVSAVTLQVQDLNRVKRFYERVFGAPCLSSSSSSSSQDGKSAALRLNGGALVVTLRESPGVRGEDSAGGGGVLLTVPVDDVGEVCRRLRSFEEEEEEEGRAAQRVAEPVTRPGGARVLTFCDPAGHCWQVGQDLERP